MSKLCGFRACKAPGEVTVLRSGAYAYYCQKHYEVLKAFGISRIGEIPYGVFSEEETIKEEDV